MRLVYYITIGLSMLLLSACTRTVQHPGYFQLGAYQPEECIPSYYDYLGNHRPARCEKGYFQSSRWAPPYKVKQLRHPIVD